MGHGRAHLESQLKRALAEEIRGLDDPRLFLLTVEGVELSPDGRLLTVYVEAFGEAGEALKALARLSSRLQSALARRVRLRHLPRLEFRPWSA
ncbi:ribosome-binding factor A [Thermus oshimai]|jgi:ribosome-binding factor A